MIRTAINIIAFGVFVLLGLVIGITWGKDIKKKFDGEPSQIAIVNVDSLRDGGYFYIEIDKPININAKWFTYQEFVTKCDHVDITPINKDLIHIVDFIRDYYSVPIYITSSYRDHECNLRANGAPKSQHLNGNALDIKTKAYTLLKEDIRTGGLVKEYLIEKNLGAVGFYNNGIIHIDVRETSELITWGIDSAGYYLDNKCNL